MPAIEIGDLSARFAESPQGTLAVVTDLGTAADIVDALPPGRPADLYIGEWPEDPRAFNAICVCPVRGQRPAGYRRMVVSGVPGSLLPVGVQGYRLPESPDWLQKLPDLQQMRDAYRALMELSRRPLRFHTLNQLAHLVRSSSELSHIGALASILAIQDMGLFAIDLNADPPRLQRTGLKKAEPENSPVWQAVQRWKNTY